MKIIEIGFYKEGKNMDELLNYGFIKESPYGKELYKRNFGEVEIEAFFKYGLQRFLIGENNPNNEIKKYTELKGFDVNDVFENDNIKKLFNQFENVKSIEFKMNKDYSKKLSVNGWKEELPNYYVYNDDIAYLNPIDTSYWLLQDDSHAIDIKNYKEKLKEIGFDLQ